VRYVDCDMAIEIPPEVAVCPYCQTRLSITVEEWTREDDGTWIATSIDMVCQTEPPLDVRDGVLVDEGFDAWLATHSEAPYVVMLPVEHRILAWLTTNYRWNMEES